jgi:hypothetical protein
MGSAGALPPGSLAVRPVSRARSSNQQGRQDYAYDAADPFGGRPVAWPSCSPCRNQASRESRSTQNRNRKLQEIDGATPLSCKIDYSIPRTYPRQSPGSAFFTGD